jgi:DNA-binding transcriptional regulator YbjK
VVDRETLLLDAAIDVLADGGMRNLTHRTVDARAGLAVGSTSNRFRTRNALLGGVLHRILERETALWTGASPRLDTSSIDVFAARLGQTVEALSGTHRALTLARHAVLVQAAVEPALHAELAAARARLTAWLSPLLADLGSRRPEEDLSCLLALVDGLLSARLVSSATTPNPTHALAALLHGLIPTV